MSVCPAIHENAWKNKVLPIIFVNPIARGGKVSMEGERADRERYTTPSARGQRNWNLGWKWNGNLFRNVFYYSQRTNEKFPAKDLFTIGHVIPFSPRFRLLFHIFES